MLSYIWNKEEWCFDLFENNKLISQFADREDLLIFIEKNYKVANLIVVNNNEE